MSFAKVIASLLAAMVVIVFLVPFVFAVVGIFTFITGR